MHMLTYRSFNSRARVGRDPPRPAGKPGRKGFNSRARVGRDQDGARRGMGSGCFNSRARVGRDLQGPERQAAARVSIRAPAWGATTSMGIRMENGLFQFARPRGARQPK